MSHTRTQRLMLAAVLSALTVVLSFLEGLLPPLPIPGVRLGLANITIMYALCNLSFPCAVGVMAVKAAFALFRGPVACLMSTVGSLLALLAMAVIHRLLRDKLSFVGLGIVGAVMHNVGQWVVAYAILGPAMMYYLPLLLLSAIPAGLLTGMVMNVTDPYLNKITFFRKG